MAPPTRIEFLRSHFYRCALSFNKKNEERLNNIRDLLEKADRNRTRIHRYPNKKRSGNRWVIPECSDRGVRGCNNKEDIAVLSANMDEATWVFDESEGDHVLTLGGFDVMKIPNDMFQRLKPFQREAVKWIAGVGPIGGILADDMGMGKTFMSVASLGARARVKRVQMVLVVAPVSVLGGWKEEGEKYLSKFVNTVRVVKVHGGNQQDRRKIIRNAWKDASFDRPYVIISSWGLVTSVRTMKDFLPPSGRCWDYVILDEAHEIKNHKSNRSKICQRICQKKGTKRLLLTGTPFQNDTTELWSITNMATGGKVLGNIKHFNQEFGKPIRDARCRNASSFAINQGEKANELLQAKLKPYLLRRNKIDFLKDELPLKREICVWLKPSPQQAMMYKEMIQSNVALAKDILSSDKELAKKAKLSAFQVIGQLIKLCGHPLRLIKGGPEVDIKSVLEQSNVASILKGSRKLDLVIHMFEGFKKEGHKVLLFSQSTENLDIIQYVLKQKNFLVGRLDGSVSEKKRQTIVELFQNGKFDVLLLSTGAGGVGLTLTRASRVIVYDPSWNPSQDAQAVDRAYRIGQTQEVRVYRLFVAGSIEEKMYEKQIHKAGLEKTIFTEGNKPEERYFDKHELSKVFAQVPDGSCELLKRFAKQGVAQVHDAHHHELVQAHSSVVGITNHSTIYRQKRKCAFSDAPNVDVKRLHRDIEFTEEASQVALNECVTSIME